MFTRSLEGSVPKISIMAKSACICIHVVGKVEEHKGTNRTMTNACLNWFPVGASLVAYLLMIVNNKNLVAVEVS